MSTPLEQIWAYLHNELSPEDKERFEQTLQNDPSLRKAMEEQRSTHEELTELTSDALSDEQLTEKLMEEWAAEHPEYAEDSTQPPNRNILRFALPLAAAAAAVILLFALPSGPIRWQRTLYGSAPQLRGEPSAQPHYTRADLKRAARELQNAVEASFEGSGKPSLQITIQELAGGALAVEVSGSPKPWKRKDSPDAVSWNESFQSLEIFRRNIPMFGKQIADEL